MKYFFFTLILFSLLSCGKKSESPKDPSPPPNGAGTTHNTSASGGEHSHVVLGLLLRNSETGRSNPSKYCVVEPGHTKGEWYKGFSYRVAQTNLTGQTDKLSMLHDARGVVEIKGTLIKDLTRTLKRGAPCNAALLPANPTLRKEWQSLECGDRPGVTTMEKLKALSYLSVNDIKASPFITIHQRGDNEAKITITNTLPIDLPAMQMQVQYEVGPGRPQPYFESFPIPPVAKGATITKIVPTIPKPTPALQGKNAILYYFILRNRVVEGGITYVIDLKISKWVLMQLGTWSSPPK